MTLVKTWTTEEEYFAKKEIERRKKLASDAKKKKEKDDVEAAKKLHWMKCPKCGMDLEEVDYRGVMIDRCFHCGGIYLDDGELEKLTGENKGLADKLFGFLK